MASWTAKEWAEVLGAVSLLITAALAPKAVASIIKLWREYRAARQQKIDQRTKELKLKLEQQEREAKERLEQRLRDEELNDKGHKFIIRRLDKRVSELEKKLETIAEKNEEQIKAIRKEYEEEIERRDKEHLQCREENAAVKTECAALRRRVEYLEAERKGR